MFFSRMSETNNKKRKSKGKWHQQNAKRRKFALCPDLKGFLLFCNSKEKETIREAYVLLNQFADRMYGPEINIQKVRMISIEELGIPWGGFLLQLSSAPPHILKPCRNLGIHNINIIVYPGR